MGDTVNVEAVETVNQETEANNQSTEFLLTGQRESEGVEEQIAENAGVEKAPEDDKKEASEIVGAPESYADFELPEGMELDNASLEQAIPVFKDLGLSQEQAQKLVSLRAEQIKADMQSQEENQKKLLGEWQKQTESDPEYGGDKFKGSVEAAHLAIDKLATPEFTKLLNDTGLGNHPEVFRIMFRIGKLMQEDVPLASGQASQKPLDRLQVLYPNEYKR